MKSELIVVEPFSFISYQEIEISERVNEHGSARIKGVLHDSTDEDMLEKITADEIITIKAILDNGEVAVIFRGIICQILLSRDGGIKQLEVCAKSHTFLMDMKKEIRIFQNTVQTFSEVAAFVGKENEARFISTEGKDQAIERLIVQYQETDWEFLKRLASMLHTVIVADSINGKISFSLGPTKPTMCEIHNYKYRADRNLAEYYRQRINGRQDCMEQDTFSLMITTRELLELCAPALISNRTYYVKGIERRLLGNELVNTYELVLSGGLKTTEISNHKIAGISLEGKVSQVERDRVQIGFEQDVNAPFIWFPFATSYSSSDGTGWYCMPEIGDDVRAYFPDEDERHGVAINMIHLTCELREQPDIKYIRSIYKKEIRFEPGAIRITNNKGTSVVLDDKKGVTIKSNRDILVMAEGNIEMHGKKEVQIVGDGGVLARQGDNKIEIRDGIQQIARTITQK